MYQFLGAYTFYILTSLKLKIFTPWVAPSISQAADKIDVACICINLDVFFDGLISGEVMKVTASKPCRMAEWILATWKKNPRNLAFVEHLFFFFFSFKKCCLTDAFVGTKDDICGDTDTDASELIYDSQSTDTM